MGLTPGDEARLMLQVVRDVSAVNDGHTALLRASYRRPLGARTLLIGSAFRHVRRCHVEPSVLSR
ncbi:hypothetical protein [Gemmatimonas sp.]|uniref:hypothetical protein n=1 Tax=Gemmatimonas sp. TaxID=1962908 RepID=UPI003DA1E032